MVHPASGVEQNHRHDGQAVFRGREKQQASGQIARQIQIEQDRAATRSPAGDRQRGHQPPPQNAPAQQGYKVPRQIQTQVVLRLNSVPEHVEFAALQCQIREGIFRDKAQARCEPESGGLSRGQRPARARLGLADKRRTFQVWLGTGQEIDLRVDAAGLGVVADVEVHPGRGRGQQPLPADVVVAPSHHPHHETAAHDDPAPLPPTAPSPLRDKPARDHRDKQQDHGPRRSRKPQQQTSPPQPPRRTLRVGQAIQSGEIQKGDRRGGQQGTVVEHIRLVKCRHARGQQANLRTPQFPAQRVEQIATARSQHRLHHANPPVFSPQKRVNGGQKVGVQRIHKERLIAEPIARDNGPGAAVVELGVDQEDIEERRVNRLIEIG